MSAEGPSWSSNMHKTGWREEGATHISISSVSEQSCTCTAVCVPPRGLGPGGVLRSMWLVSIQNEDLRREFHKHRTYFFLPGLCFLVFLSLCYCLILWFDFLKNGGRYRVKQCSRNEAQRRWNRPPTSFKPTVSLLKTQGRHKYEGEQAGRPVHPCMCSISPQHTVGTERMQAQGNPSFYLNSSVVRSVSE